MKIKSTTNNSGCVFGDLRECIKCGQLEPYTAYPSHIKLVTKRINRHGEYVDQYFTTEFNQIGNAKFRLYRNDLEITFGRKTLRIPDLDRYYAGDQCMPARDRMNALLCDEIMRLISEEINKNYPNRYKGYYYVSVTK